MEIRRWVVVNKFYDLINWVYLDYDKYKWVNKIECLVYKYNMFL